MRCTALHGMKSGLYFRAKLPAMPSLRVLVLLELDQDRLRARRAQRPNAELLARLPLVHCFEQNLILPPKPRPGPNSTFGDNHYTD